jgi:hypothetical protein
VTGVVGVTALTVVDRGPVDRPAAAEQGAPAPSVTGPATKAQPRAANESVRKPESRRPQTGRAEPEALRDSQELVGPTEGPGAAPELPAAGDTRVAPPRDTPRRAPGGENPGVPPPAAQAPQPGPSSPQPSRGPAKPPPAQGHGDHGAGNGHGHDKGRGRGHLKHLGHLLGDIIRGHGPGAQGRDRLGKKQDDRDGKNDRDRRDKADGRR